MRTFATTKRSTFPERPRASVPDLSSHARRAEVRQILHGPRLQPKASAGRPNDNVIQRYKLSSSFCLLAHENKRINDAHREAVARSAKVLKLLSGPIPSSKAKKLKKYFGQRVLDPANLATIKANYSRIHSALTGDYTYYCADKHTAPEPCSKGTNAQTMGVCSAGTELRNEGFLKKPVKAEDGDVALCMDKMKIFTLKGLANVFIHENLHRSGVCGHYSSCTNEFNGECSIPPSDGNCANLADASFVAENPDSYGCFAIQAKMRIGAPDDRFEKEADHVADQVMRMSDGAIEAEHIQRCCLKCEEKEKLQRDSTEEEGKPVQARARPDDVPRITGDVAARIRALKGRGQPLPASARAFFEPRFGTDFSQVRTHTGPAAAELARQVEARAFTVGRDIVFGEGQYAPGMADGRRLLAHELTHTIQQQATAPALPRSQVRQVLVGQRVKPHTSADFSSVPRRKPASGSNRKSKVKTGWIDSHWSYVTYPDQGMIRVARNVSSMNRDKRIGTIPWITNNPGNLTVTKSKSKAPGAAARQPFKSGAVDEVFSPKNKMHYAIFPSYSTGKAAILPVLKAINKGNGGRLDMASALSIYYAGTGKKDPSYVKAIRKFMAEAISAESPSLKEGRAQEIVGEILARQVSKFTGMDDDFFFVAEGLIRKEGRSNPPGVEYLCDGGFAPNAQWQYTPGQFKAINAFKKRHEATLRKILGCSATRRTP